PAAHAAVYQHKSFRLSDLHLARLDRVLAAQMGTWLPVSSPREGYNLQSNDGRHQKEAPRRTEYSRTRVGLDIPREIKKAVAMGDLSENAEYHMAKQRQEYLKARVRQLGKRLADLSLV